MISVRSRELVYVQRKSFSTQRSQNRVIRASLLRVEGACSLFVVFPYFLLVSTTKFYHDVNKFALFEFLNDVQ